MHVDRFYIQQVLFVTLCGEMESDEIKLKKEKKRGHGWAMSSKQHWYK
jgi:hypothetical protein